MKKLQGKQPKKQTFGDEKTRPTNIAKDLKHIDIRNTLLVQDIKGEIKRNILTKIAKREDSDVQRMSIGFITGDRIEL